MVSATAFDIGDFRYKYSEARFQDKAMYAERWSTSCESVLCD